MLDTLTFSELEAQEVELLPARTVLSLISTIPPKPKPPGGNATTFCGGSGIFVSAGLIGNSCTSNSGGSTFGGIIF
jgi:hypothetical protein